MEKNGWKVICAAPTTLTVKRPVMMIILTLTTPTQSHYPGTEPTNLHFLILVMRIPGESRTSRFDFFFFILKIYRSLTFHSASAGERSSPSTTRLSDCSYVSNVPPHILSTNWAHQLSTSPQQMISHCHRHRWTTKKNIK